MDRTALVERVLGLAESGVEVADGARCTELLTDISATRAWLDAFEADVTIRVGELHDAGASAPAVDVLTDAGVSAGDARRTVRRAETVARAPAFGSALTEGRIGADHVDALTNAMARFDDAVTDGLFERADELLALAESLTPSTFGRRVRERARRRSEALHLLEMVMVVPQGLLKGEDQHVFRCQTLLAPGRCHRPILKTCCGDEQLTATRLLVQPLSRQPLWPI